MTNRELVEAVKSHALENYEKDGWDIVVETMTDEEIGKAIGKARTVRGAIRNVKSLACLWDDRRSDVYAEAGLLGEGW